MRTDGVSNTISWKQGNELGFQKKSFRGHMADFKARCAAAGRMDLWHRLLAIKERRAVTFRAVTALEGILHKRGAAAAEHYMDCMDAHPSLASRDVRRARALVKVASAVGLSTIEARSTRSMREARLALPDEPWMEPVE